MDAITRQRDHLAVGNQDGFFYSKLLLFSLISPFRAEHDQRDDTGSIPEDECRLRRDFLDKISYLCDVEKSGSTVTAAALREVPAFNILWLASNEGVRPGVGAFVDRILQLIRKVNVENREETENIILRDALDMASHRINFYRSKMRAFAKACIIEDQGHSGENTLQPWLKNLKKINNTSELVLKCYEARSKELPIIRTQAETWPKNADGTNDYSELAHYIGRLGAHVHAVRVVVKAGLKVSSIRNIREICKEEPLTVKKVRLSPHHLNPYKTMTEVCSKLERTQMDKHMLAFFHQDRLHGFQEKVDLLSSKTLSSNLIATRVHAEVLLADLFSRRDFKFVNDDKYIGCSKGACYCCASYFEMHHKDFVKPASHNKVILNWRGPEANPVLDKRGFGHHKLLMMKQKMNWKLDNDLLKSLSNNGSGISFQHLSTNGFSQAASVLTMHR